MNIFAVDACPFKSADALRDDHIVKMPLETAQILCAVAHRYGVPARYKLTHARHPCVLWAGETRTNVAWAWLHGFALCEAYRKRYGREHACAVVLVELEAAGLLMAVPDGPLTPFAQAMPDVYRREDAHEAYRAYYAAEKAVGPRARWTRRERPEWLPAVVL